VLEPNEEGRIEIVLDTRRFQGPKTVALYLQTDNGKRMETIFYITADAQ
jgi:hypothetical protein